MLVPPDGARTPFTAKLDFIVTNNVSEYEVYMIGLEMTLGLRARRMEKFNLIISHARRD